MSKVIPTHGQLSPSARSAHECSRLLDASLLNGETGSETGQVGSERRMEAREAHHACLTITSSTSMCKSSMSVFQDT